MKRTVFLAAFTLCLSVLGQERQAFAQNKDQNDLYDQLIQEGWTVAAPGVMQRDLSHGKVETLGFGADGLRFKIQQMQEHLSFLRQEYASQPTPKVRKSIRAYKTEIERLTQALATAKSIDQEEGLAAMSEKSSGGIDCTIKYGAHVNAFPLTGSSQGVGATTDSYFNSNCGQTGEVYAHSYSKATGADNVIRTATHTDPVSGIRSGSNVTATTSDTVVGVRDCYSYSYATMTSYDIGVTYSQSVTNYTCPTPALPPSVTITGVALSGILGYNCKTITWSSTVTGGTPAYTYTWYRGGYQAGTSSSYSETFCGNNVSGTETVNLSLTVRDAANQTGSDTHTTTINYSGSGGSCGGTRICQPDY
jgi:hypothetical protein